MDRRTFIQRLTAAAIAVGIPLPAAATEAPTNAVAGGSQLLQIYLSEEQARYFFGEAESGWYTVPFDVDRD